MMTPEERARQEARARRHAAMAARPGADEPADGTFSNSMGYVAELSPVPDTAGLPPAEAEATPTRRRAEVHQFLDDRAARSRAAHPPAPRAAAS